MRRQGLLSILRPRLPVLLAIIPVLMSIAACDQVSVQDVSPTSPPITAANTSVPTATVTESQLQPTATQAPSPTTDESGEPTVVSQPTCALDYFFEPAPPQCPLDEPLASAAAEQPFEGGVMIWLEVTDSVYVLYADQGWRRYADTWSEDQPESDPAIIPPEGRYQPIRGFGKVWREHPEVRERLGWALGPELAFESRQQHSLIGEGEDSITFLLTFNGQVVALTNRAQDEGDWVIATS